VGPSAVAKGQCLQGSAPQSGVCSPRGGSAGNRPMGCSTDPGWSAPGVDGSRVFLGGGLVARVGRDSVDRDSRTRCPRLALGSLADQARRRIATKSSGRLTSAASGRYIRDVFRARPYSGIPCASCIGSTLHGISESPPWCMKCNAESQVSVGVFRPPPKIERCRLVLRPRRRPGCVAPRNPIGVVSHQCVVAHQPVK